MTTYNSFTIIFVCSFLLFAVQGLQINFKSTLSNSKITVTKDTAEAYYETIIDDVLSQHNEGLLTELSAAIKTPHELSQTMRPQAELLLGVGSSIQDICVAQLPGMIANQIHELSNEIYSSIDTIINKFWTKSDMEYRQLILKSINKGDGEQEIVDELITFLEIINVDIADDIIAVVDRYDMYSRIRSALQTCQSVFDKEGNRMVNTVQQESSSLTEKIWTSLLVSLKQSLPGASAASNSSNGSSRQGFLNVYVTELTSDLQSELYGRVYELARGIYEDLASSS
ncbi:MAG: hypothetical protein EXX96DRAFT_577643 [Benjaminiella poitrasii]|nr:MAG: hypothetical protein EXX96DRAFT_577643 [Benjaminiella poitrasii]